MMPAPGWYFGSRGTRDLNDPFNPQGGFNLGGSNQTPFQGSDSVTQSTPGVSGTSAVGPSQPASQQPDAGAEGSSPDAAPSGPGFSVGEAASTAANGGSLSIGGFGPGTLGMANSVANMAGMGLHGPVTAPFGLANMATNTIAQNMVDPVTGLPVAQIANNPGIVAASEDFSGDTPAAGNPNTTIGSIIAAIQAANQNSGSTGGFASIGSNGSSVSPAGGVFSSLGVPTGNVAVSPNSTEITGVAPQGTEFSGRGVDPDSSDPSDSGNDGGTGAPGGPAGSGPAGTGEGGASGVGGDGGVGTGPGDKRGGRVGSEPNRKKGQRPDPRQLSAKLKAGATVQSGSKRPGADDVPVRLSRGEEVVNKNATDKFGPILDAMNKAGNRQGGFSVGRR
jgi:collagen type I/II/III/V/XI/XXIV/XXVII alpha